MAISVVNEPLWQTLVKSAQTVAWTPTPHSGYFW